MKDKKNAAILQQMVLLMIENDYISVASMAKILNYSEKTIRSKLNELHDQLVKAQLARIEKVPRMGVKLVITSGSVEKLKQLFNTMPMASLVNGEERLYAYLRILLSTQSQQLTVNELSELTYDSLPVCKRYLKTCEQWLDMFVIKMDIRRNYGIELLAKEENMRLAIKHLVVNDPVNNVENSIRLFAKGINLDLLKKCIFKIEAEWNFSFAEESFYSILLYAALAITRCGFSNIKLSKSEKDIVVQYNEYHLAQSLFQLIEKEFMIAIPESEIQYFAIQLLCSKMIHTHNEEEDVREYDAKLRQFVEKIIDTVSNVMNVDLTKDSELYYGLLNHIRPAIFRMKFEKHSTEELTSFIKEEYKQTYRVSWTLSVLFEEYYGIKISSTELSYITLYIQASLERRVKPLKIALITELGMGLNQMFCSKIKMAIPQVEEIKIFSLHDFKLSYCTAYDLLLTTSQLQIEDPRILQISSLLSNQGLEILKSKVEEMRFNHFMNKNKFDACCHTLFEPDLILIQEGNTSKKNLIKKMTELLVDKGYVTKQYFTSVMEREKSVSTYIGNGVAIPHGFSNFVNESKVVIATLKEEMEWNKEDQVKIIFMLALSVNTTYESKRTQLFYKGFLEMIDTDEDVEKLINMNAEELYKYVIR